MACAPGRRWNEGAASRRGRCAAGATISERSAAGASRTSRYPLEFSNLTARPNDKHEKRLANAAIRPWFRIAPFAVRAVRCSMFAPFAVRAVRCSRRSAVRAIRCRAVRLCARFGCARRSAVCAARSSRGSAVRAVRLCAPFGCLRRSQFAPFASRRWVSFLVPQYRFLGRLYSKRWFADSRSSSSRSRSSSPAAHARTPPTPDGRRVDALALRRGARGAVVAAGGVAPLRLRHRRPLQRHGGRESRAAVARRKARTDSRRSRAAIPRRRTTRRSPPSRPSG